MGCCDMADSHQEVAVKTEDYLWLKVLSTDKEQEWREGVGNVFEWGWLGEGEAYEGRRKYREWVKQGGEEVIIGRRRNKQ